MDGQLKFFERQFSSVQFAQIEIKKWGRRYQAVFFSKYKGVKAEVSIDGESVQNVIDKTEAFLEVKLLTEEICIHEKK